MFTTAAAMKGYRLGGLDGDIGKVRDFYFDDHHWAVRYLVADTGHWLTGKQVLISPYALAAVTKEARHIAVRLTKTQIEDSPALDTDAPVSRQFEEAYYGYYEWPAYWGGPYMWGAYAYPYMGLRYPSLERAATTPQDATAGEDAWDPYLRSTHDVHNHRIQATDVEMGQVEDFIIDDKTWAIRYLVVDTRNCWPVKHVLISPRWIDRISWGESTVFVNLSRDALRHPPEYTADSLLTRDYEISLHHHYNRPGYWVDEPAAQEHARCITPTWHAKQQTRLRTPAVCMDRAASAQSRYHGSGNDRGAAYRLSDCAPWQ